MTPRLRPPALAALLVLACGPPGAAGRSRRGRAVAGPRGSDVARRRVRPAAGDVGLNPWPSSVPPDVRLRAFRAFVAGHGERSYPRPEPVVSGRQDPGYLDELPALLAGVDAPAARVLEARVADALRRRGAPLPRAQDVVSEQAPR